MCSVFRTFQGWTALSDMAHDQGVLFTVPIPEAMAYMMLRPLLSDIPEDHMCGVTLGQVFQIKMSYSSAARQLTTVTTNNGQMYGTAQVISVPANFDFRVGSFSVSSYSNQKADGSILAHGVIDNVVVTTPDSPIQQLTGGFGTNGWQVQFFSRSNWVYTLERTTDFAAWTTVTSTSSTGGMLSLVDTSPPSLRSFYRISAARP